MAAFLLGFLEDCSLLPENRGGRGEACSEPFALTTPLSPISSAKSQEPRAKSQEPRAKSQTGSGAILVTSYRL